MLASFLVVFRELVEAGLIVGIVLAATRDVENRFLWSLCGIVSGVLGALLVAFFAGMLQNAFSGNGQEIFNATILCLAVVMLGWHNFWMSHHGKEIANEMRALGQDVRRGEKTMFAMAVVIAIAVLREGSEIVLFLYGIAVSADAKMSEILIGGLLGICAGVSLSFFMYKGLVFIPMRWFFGVTSALIAFLAAGMAGKAVALLVQDDLLPAMGYRLWNSSWLIADDSLAGRAASALFGYTAHPMGIQLLAWFVTLCVLFFGPRLLHDGKRTVAKATL